jgi:SNF2 family DNA or RNA helicase
LKDSIEERIVKLQESKSMQAKGTMQTLSGNQGMKNLKALLGDLRGLLQIDE